MPDLSITDSLGKPVDISTVKWTSGSSLYNYLKSELLHLAVVPDFIKIKDKTLTQAAPKPTSFKLSVQHDFQLGGTAPEIDFTPSAEVDLIINATPGSDLFDRDSFHLPVTVPTQTGYVGMSFQGSLDQGVSGSSGDLTFGIAGNRSITLEFVKAFQTGQNEPSLWDATAAVLSDFVIPTSVDDLKRLKTNDVCCVSGEGSFQISGLVNVSVSVNPLASVNLPLGVGTLTVHDGVMAGLSASLTLSGSYQIRTQRLTKGIVRLSFLRERETVLETDLSASAGVSTDLGKTDLLAKLLGTIGKGTVDQKMLDGLTADEVQTFTSTLKKGIDHSLQASVDLALSESNDNQIAFQYDIQPDLLSVASIDALNRALKGDLSLLTALEDRMQSDGTVAPGVKLLNSVFSEAKTKGFSLKVNLLGIVNLISSSKLIGKCEFLFEPFSGDLTIKETGESDRIGAITDPYRRQEALRKALFDSVLVTTTYVVSKAITMSSLSCEAVHFAANQNTSNQTIADYTNWFVALNLMKPTERTAVLGRAGSGGLSTCVVSAPFDDACCEAMFFDAQGNLRDRAQYLEIGRQALKALLGPADSPIDQFRYNFLDNDATWQKAVETGPSPQLRDLIPLASTDPKLAVVLNNVSGDLYIIVWWANSMQTAGRSLHDMRAFLAGRDPVTLADNPDFASRRGALQKLMLKIVGSNKARFNQPWGIVCLYWAAGSRRSSGKITAGTLVLQRDDQSEGVPATGLQRPPSPWERWFGSFKAGVWHEPPALGPAISIQTLRLRNIRMFTDTGEVHLSEESNDSLPLGSVSVFVGDNAAGKSTVLRCLVLAALGPELANQAERRPESYLRHNEERGFIEVLFGLDPGASITSGLEIRRGEHSFTAIQPEDLTIGHLNAASGIDGLRRRIDDDFGFFCGYGSLRTFADPSSPTPAQDKAVLDRVASLFDAHAPVVDPDVLSKLVSGSLANFRGAPERLDDSTREAIAIHLRRLLPGCGDLSQGTQGAVPVHGNPVPLLDLSDGYASVLALAGHLFFHALASSNWTGDPGLVRGVAFIDEIDAHLHPAWQRRILPDLRTVFPNLQILATTHSPMVAGSADTSSICLLKRELEGVRLITDLPSIDGWRADQILTSVLFDLPTSRNQQTEDLLRRYADRLAEFGPEDSEVQKLGPEVAKAMQIEGEGKVDRTTHELLDGVLLEKFRALDEETRRLALAKAGLVLAQS